MKPTPYDHCWEDKSNWKWYCIYYCKDDPRIVVPKKPAWAGRTLNFAHSRSYWCLFWTLVLACAPILLVEKVSPPVWIILYLSVITALIVFYYKTDIRAG